MKCICGYEQEQKFNILSAQDSDAYWNNSFCENYIRGEYKSRVGRLYVCPKCGTVKFVLDKEKLTIKEIENRLGYEIEIINEAVIE